MTDPDVARDLATLSASLTDYLLQTALELEADSSPLDSATFSDALKQAGCELARFALDVRRLGLPERAVDHTSPEPFLSSTERGLPPHRRQTQEMVQVVDLVRGYAEAYYLADTKKEKASAVSALIELSLFTGVAFCHTAKLMLVRVAYRDTRSLTQLAVQLSTSPDQVKQMLADAEVLLAGPPPRQRVRFPLSWLISVRRGRR